MRDRTCSRRLTKFALYETLGDGMGPCGHARMTRISLAVLATMLLAACSTQDASAPTETHRHPNRSRRDTTKTSPPCLVGNLSPDCPLKAIGLEGYGENRSLLHPVFALNSLHRLRRPVPNDAIQVDGDRFDPTDPVNGNHCGPN